MTIASPFPVVQLPTTSVYEFLFDDLTDDDADRIALIEVATGLTLTYRDLTQQIEAFAGALAARGIGAGDVVGLLAPNSAAFAVAFHGILRAGATVIGVRDMETGEEVPKAFVVRQPNSPVSGQEVMDFVAGQVAPYKKVRQVEFTDSIPKSASGKILRRELRGD
ncbi:AMP-binding protein [Mycobacterium sp. OTB74]|uniref:AMP-binding protein n=1 Tax=Mycobacterium sp. OTB74 TaxID=1853452 RepID=UPI00247573BB|nr:AMP-binding protein [Mycobacterium sp. OTB74]MDH6242927.1 acyl-coenzyme A synthetase/AMP-(fatty) acid ligase [Mycobacterium sp. OTB74]